MRVAISVLGRFWFFNLAQELLKRGYLSQLITSYPKFEVAKWGIPKDKTDSVVLKEIVQRGYGKLPGFLRHLYNPQYLLHRIFDRGSVKHLRDADILTALASSSSTMKEAKRRGMTVIVESGSSHVLYQDAIMREEYARWNIPSDVFLALSHPKTIEETLEAYEEMDYIAVPSLFVKRTFLERGFCPEKLIHVPFGVDTSSFRQVPKEDDVFRVVFAGGMTLRKGIHYLLQAFSELNLPNSELLLMGSMNDEARGLFRKFAGYYRYLGHVPQRELHKYYSQGSVFVLPSLEEGLAMVQAQAMACGLPVVCTTNTGGEDIVRDGTDGFVIPIRDVNAIKEKILFFYENPDARERMGQSAKERVSRGFTWQDYGDRVVSEYKRILAGK